MNPRPFFADSGPWAKFSHGSLTLEDENNFPLSRRSYPPWYISVAPPLQCSHSGQWVQFYSRSVREKASYHQAFPSSARFSRNNTESWLRILLSRKNRAKYRAGKIELKRDREIVKKVCAAIRKGYPFSLFIRPRLALHVWPVILFLRLAFGASRLSLTL